MFSRDSRGDDLFSKSTFDATNPDKIIIREKEASKKKIRRRVKKGTKDAILAKEKEIKKASKVKVTKQKDKTEKKSVYDTVSFDVVDLDREISADKKPDNSVKREDKGFKLPRLSEINKAHDDFDDNDLGSDFRKSSADWKDAVIPDFSGLDELGSDDSFFAAFKNASWMQYVAMALAVVLFVSSILTTNVYAKLQCADLKAEAFSKLTKYEDTSFEQVAMAVENVEEPISLEEATPQIGKVLSLVLTSVEKDLKIKLIDEDETLVKDVPWSVTVADSEGNSSEESDDDLDGIIHMTDVNAGDYTVTLNPNDSLADFELPKSAQMVSVKAKVEYKVIANIKDEIKSEKEVNVAAEDTGGNQAADVEAALNKLQDTVEFVESTKTVNGEEYVEAAVDISKTAKLEKTGTLLAVAEKIKTTAQSNLGNVSVLFPLLLTHVDGEHTFDYTPNNDGKHTCKCTDPECNHTMTEECVINDENGECSKCGYKPKPAEQNHTQSYSSNGNGTHNVTCSVSECNQGHINNNVACEYENGKCKYCNYTKPAEQEHKSTYISNNNGTHKVTCSVSGCNQGHNKDSETCTIENGKCKYCSYQPTHNLTYAPNNNGTHKVICSVSGCNQNHNNNSVACTYENGKCKFCSYKQPDPSSFSLSGTTTIKVDETTKITASISPTGKKISGVTFSDSSIASCTYDSTSVTVKGLKAGSTKMTVKSDNGKSADITITVNAKEQKYADDAQLYDASKNALYVKEGDSYRLAKYRDYKNNSTQKFYRKVETFLYTGWQTIDGQKCYFDKNHNKVTGKQVIGGVEYDFGESGTVSAGSGSLGIDVSKYQPSINWAAVKSSGVDYVIIRCGYRGSSTGALIEDPYFKSHIKGAKAAGLKVGVYFFTTAVTEAEAVEEASMCAYLCNGYGLDFPIFMDCESSPRAGYNGMSASQRTAIIKAFCNTVRSAGYSAGVYANKTWLSSYMNAGELSGYKIWLAQYNSAPTYSGKYDMWQYTSKGSVNGISGYVDMNKCYYR